MNTTSWDRVIRHIRVQADACGELGSPLYEVLLERLADDLLAHGPSAEVLAGHESDLGPSALALRLMGGVHRLVLDGRAPALASYYPSAGGVFDPESTWPPFREVLADHRDELRASLQHPPQTNEVGRAAALLGGLMHVLAWRPGSIRLFEIGASAGLNLWADRFRLPLGDGRGIGPADSPVVLRDGWRGVLPPVPDSATDVRVEIVERRGCDTEPLDPRTEEGRLRLTSYVWPDQMERIARLRGAMDLALDLPWVVDRMSAGQLVSALELRRDTTTVLWHSVMWQYLPAEERDVVGARIRELGRAATDEASFAHLMLEPTRRTQQSDHQFLVVLKTWPGGDERVLGVAHPHGVPTTWE